MTHSTLNTTTQEPLAVSIDEAIRLSGIGRTKIYEAIRAGELRSLKIGTRRLVTLEALRDWLNQNEITPLS